MDGRVMCRVMRSEPDNDRDIMIWLLCMQIEGNDCWDDILRGLNEKGSDDMIEFIHSILYHTAEHD